MMTTVRLSTVTHVYMCVYVCVYDEYTWDLLLETSSEQCSIISYSQSAVH